MHASVGGVMRRCWSNVMRGCWSNVTWRLRIVSFVSDRWKWVPVCGHPTHFHGNACNTCVQMGFSPPNRFSNLIVWTFLFPQGWGVHGPAPLVGSLQDGSLQTTWRHPSTEHFPKFKFVLPSSGLEFIEKNFDISTKPEDWMIDPNNQLVSNGLLLSLCFIGNLYHAHAPDFFFC